eukprot:1928272-Amphidinium_carterae.1
MKRGFLYSHRLPSDPPDEIGQGQKGTERAGDEAKRTKTVGPAFSVRAPVTRSFRPLGAGCATAACGPVSIGADRPDAPQ